MKKKNERNPYKKAIQKILSVVFVCLKYQMDQENFHTIPWKNLHPPPAPSPAETHFWNLVIDDLMLQSSLPFVYCWDTENCRNKGTSFGMIVFTCKDFL